MEELTVGTIPEASTQGSYFRQLEVKEHVTLLPCYLGRVGSGVIELLTSRILHYNDIYGGVLLAFSHVRVLQSTGRILDELPHIHIDVQYRATVFRPDKGDVMRGYVTKVGKDHVGCVLYGCFNASVVSSAEGGRGDWWSREFGEGEEVWFVVTELDVTRSLLSLRGEYVDMEELGKREGGRGGGGGGGVEEGGGKLNKQVVCDDGMVRGDGVMVNGVRRDTVSEHVRRRKRKLEKKGKHKEEKEEEEEGVEEGGGLSAAMEERLSDGEGEIGSYEGVTLKKGKHENSDGTRDGEGGGGDGGRKNKHRKRDKHKVKGRGGDGDGTTSDVGRGVEEEGRRKRKRHKEQSDGVGSGGEKERNVKKRKLKV